MSESIAKIDAYRARRMGEMLVSADQVASFTQEPKDLLLDLAGLDGRELLNQYRAKNAQFASAPFDPSGDKLRFYPGGVTIWSGHPGAGKSTILRQFICHTLHRGSSVFVASLEEDPRDIPIELAATACGCEEPNAHQVQWLLDEYQSRLRIWSTIGIARRSEMIGAIQYLAGKGIRHYVIDSLMRLDVATDNTEAQREFANTLSTVARINGIHIHLVAHPRKPSKDADTSDQNEVGGARELIGIADNILFIRRRKDLVQYMDAEVTPMAITISKQRKNRGKLGSIDGWFHRKFRQFSHDQFREQPARYLPNDAFVELRA